MRDRLSKNRADGLRVVSPEPVENSAGLPFEQSRDSLTSSRSVAVPDRSNLAIETSAATLCYPVGPYVRGSLKSSLLGLFGHRDSTPRPTFVDALRSIDLRISFGERVALIGHNGSGKSSLLRALAGIYPLASGEITVVGRIGALLDVALGFESESTGRENIYYRGMTMGFSRKQLREAEAEIVRFADLGDFIDLPMRMYSTGMYVRLGFAISTHFMPDILLVDEVFGAGDAAFAKQAVDRMMRLVTNAGIFVIATHDLNLVQTVCHRAIWLDGGKIARDGPATAVVAEYHKHMQGEAVLNA